MNYEIDVLELPKGTKIGDTVNIVDESGEVYFSARILKTEISETGRSVSVTIGDYLIKDNGISQQVQDLAGNFKNLAANRTLYTWTAYADDEYGSGISLDPSGKSYLGTRTNQTVRDPDISNPELYKWMRVKGEEGVNGADAITLTVTSSNGIIFKNNSGSTVLTAHVFKGATEQTVANDGTVSGIGVVKWYKVGGSAPIATAKTLTVSAVDVTNAQAYTCQLED